MEKNLKKNSKWITAVQLKHCNINSTSIKKKSGVKQDSKQQQY